MALSKINKLVREFPASGTVASTLSVLINSQNLSMPGGSIFDTGGDYDGAYLIEVIVLRVAGSNTLDGSVRRTFGTCVRNGAYGTIIPTTQDTFIASKPPGITMSASGTSLSVDISHPAAVNANATTVTYKVFINVFSYGQDDIPSP